MTSWSVAPRTSVQLADYLPGAAFGPRRLRDFEFVWMLDGSATWTMHAPDETTRAPQRIVLRPGTLALSTQGLESYAWDVEKRSTHAYVHFQVRGDFPVPVARWPVTRSLLRAPVLAGICDYLIRLGRTPGGTAMARSDQMIALLLDLYVAGPLEEAPAALHPCVQATLDCAARAWLRSGPRIMSGAELASAAGVSVGHLYRVFRDKYGMGPARVLELTRLARSAVSLQRSNASLAEIAVQNGFADPYHFSRRFAATYTMPPGLFRQRGDETDPLGPIRANNLLPVCGPLLASSGPARR